MSPVRPPHACPGCGTATTGKGRCQKCRSTRNRQIDERRNPDATAFYRTSEWQAIRKRILDAEPCCRACSTPEHPVLARDVDHVVPREHGGSDEDDNLQPLCGPCHSRKTMTELNAARAAGATR